MPYTPKRDHIPNPFGLDKKQPDLSLAVQIRLLFCERVVKRCVNVGKNSEKVFITLIYFSFALFFLGYVKTKNFQSV